MTTAKRGTLLYDGDCALCRRAAGALLRDAPPGTLEVRSFRDPGVLDAFPEVDASRAEDGVQLVRADGSVAEGAQAILEAARSRWWVRLLRSAHARPRLRRWLDAGYAWVARNRHRARPFRMRAP